MSQLQVQHCTGKAGLAEIYDEWAALLATVEERSFYQHPAWFQAYFDRSDGGDGPLKFITVRRAQRLVAVVPCFERSTGLVKRSALARHVGIHVTDVVVHDDESKPAIWASIKAAARRGKWPRWDVFYVPGSGVLESSAIAGCLLAETDSVFTETLPTQCMVIDVAPYDELLSGLKSKFRNNLKRSIRRLDEMGDYYIEQVTQPAAIDAAYRTFVELEKSGWKGDTGTSKAGYPEPSAIALQPWKLQFYAHVMQAFAKLSAAQIYLLHAGGKVIGAQIYIALNHTSYLLKTAMDPNIKGIAPGHVMINDVLQRYAADGRITQINLMTDYSWHEAWNPRSLDYLNFVDYNTTPMGRLSAMRRRLKQSA